MLKMKRKIVLLISALLALSIVAPTLAESDMFLVMNCEVTGIVFYPSNPDGSYRVDIPFEGVVGGPWVKEGVVEGVDLFFRDAAGVGHVNAFSTITDKDGDKLSINAVGISETEESGRIILDALATVIDTAEYPTTGKYSSLISEVFRDEGFISDFSVFPPEGYVHAKLYWTD
jgi:hypothetical protein